MQKTAIPSTLEAQEMLRTSMNETEQLKLLDESLSNEMIKEYIICNIFTGVAEIKFLDKADEAMFNFYISRHPLSESGQEHLVMYKDDEWIASYLYNHYLCKNAVRSLNRRYKNEFWMPVEMFFRRLFRL